MDRCRWEGKVLEFYRYLHFILFLNRKLVGCSSSFLFFFKSGRTCCLPTAEESLERSQGWALRPSKNSRKMKALPLPSQRWWGTVSTESLKLGLLGAPVLYSPEHICRPVPWGTRRNEGGRGKKNSVVEAKSPPLPTLCARLRNLGDNAPSLGKEFRLRCPIIQGLVFPF